jgi:predicted ATPase
MSDLAPDTFVTFGDLLKHLRRRARLTQQEFGAAVGYSHAHVARLESGERLPDLTAIKALFIPALDLGDAPALAQRLLDLAAAAHGVAPSTPPSQPAPPAAVHPPAPGNPYRAGSLPAQLTPFIGRAQEVEAVRQLLRRNRLVTLTGAGGVGKTRLAIEVAQTVRDDFADGVWLVEFAPLADLAQVAQAVVDVFGIQLRPGARPLQALTTFLKDQCPLVLLDNCEHLVSACAELAEALLRACPHLLILATSREALRVPSEVAWRVPSMRTPAPADLPALEHMLDYEAVELFVQIASAVQPGFALTPANQAPVARICHHLDGIPLAIEMAAAQLVALTADEISAGLGDCMALLTSASRTAPPRHQTLRAALDWSFALLSPPEQRLLERLSVFAGGWTADAAQQVCGDMAAVLPDLVQLVRKSLVVAAPNEATGGTRYRLLETIRQAAGARLSACGEAEAIRERHLAFHLAMVEETMDLGGRHVDARVRRIEPEYDNLRAAFAWARARAEWDQGEMMLRLAGGLRAFWYNRGFLVEGLAWLEEGLARGTNAPTTVRAKALLAQATLYAFISDSPHAYDCAEAGLALFQQAGDALGSAWCMTTLAYTAADCGDNRATAIGEQAVRMCREAGSLDGTCLALMVLGRAACNADDKTRAGEALEEAMAIARQIGDIAVLREALIYLWDVDPRQALKQCEREVEQCRLRGDQETLSVFLRCLGRLLNREKDCARAAAALEESLSILEQCGGIKNSPILGGIPNATSNLGLIEYRRGNYGRAIELLERGVKLLLPTGDIPNARLTQTSLAAALMEVGQLDRAAVLLRESLQAFQQYTQWDMVYGALNMLALQARQQGQPLRSARLLGAMEALACQYDVAPIRNRQRNTNEANAAATRAQLGDAAFEDAFAEGQAMAVEQAIAYALQEDK